MMKSDAGALNLPTRAKQWLLPPEGTLFQLRGRQYQVTYVNYGKLRFAARFVQVMPEQVSREPGAGSREPEKKSRGRRFWAAVKRGFGG